MIPGASNSGLPYWLWSVQLDVDVELVKRNATKPAGAADSGS